MAVRIPIYSIYKLGRAERHYLLQTEQPGYSNVSQGQQDLAQHIELESRQGMLALLLQALPQDERLLCEFIGELQDWPVGDDLVRAPSYSEWPVYYLHTHYGHPWIILGTATSATEFLAEIAATEELVALQPIGPPIKIVAVLVRAQDVSW